MLRVLDEIRIRRGDQIAYRTANRCDRMFECTSTGNVRISSRVLNCCEDDTLGVNRRGVEDAYVRDINRCHLTPHNSVSLRQAATSMSIKGRHYRQRNRHIPLSYAPIKYGNHLLYYVYTYEDRIVTLLRARILSFVITRSVVSFC